MGIRFKLIQPLALMFGAFALMMHIFWVPVQLETAQRDFVSQQKSELTALQESLARYLLSGDLASMHATLSNQLELRADRWRDLIVFDAEGQRVFPLRLPKEAAVLGPHAKRYTHPIVIRGSHVGEIDLVIDWQSRHDAMTARIWQLELFFLIVFALSMLVSLVWQNFLIRTPLARLEQAAQQLAKSEFETPLPAVTKDEIGSLTQSFTRMRDELKQSRNDLNLALAQSRESDARQRTIFNTMGDGLITIDADGIVVMCNPAALRIFAYREEELTGIHVTKILPDFDEIKICVSSYAEQGGTQREQNGCRKDGSIFPIYINLSEMELSGRRHYGAIVRDISAQKAAEQELRIAHQQAQAASKAKSAFLATMSHEIRTPMNGVIGVVQLLELTPLNDEQKEYVEIIEKSGDSLLSLIDDILDLSKIESGKMQLAPAVFDLESVALDTIQLLSSKAEEKGIDLLFHYAVDCPNYLIGDAQRIRQVLVNLVGNALKFTDHGHVMLHVNLIDQSPSSAKIEIVVEDSGIGIAKESQDKLFEAFTQADSSTTRRFGGTGLGLAICKRVVDLMAGEIGVSSEPGKGSRFRIVLDLPLSDEAKSVSAEVLSGVRTVVVGPDVQQRRLLVEQLGGFNMDVVELGEVSLLQQSLTQAHDSNQAVPLVILFSDKLQDEEPLLAVALRQLHAFPSTRLAVVTSGRTVSNTSDQAAFDDAHVCRIRLPILTNILAQTLTQLITQAPQQNDIEPASSLDRRELIVNQQRQAQALNAVSEDSVKHFSGKILVVDDVADNLTIVESMLESLGLAVDSASNGKEAVALWQASDYDMILMDCQMPVMDGYQATSVMKKQAQAQGRVTPVIIGFTAAVMQQDQDRCYQAGMDGTLLKPIKKSALIEVLNQWLPVQVLGNED